MSEDFESFPDDMRAMADVVERIDLYRDPESMEEILAYMSLRDMAARLSNTVDRLLPPEYQREVSA